MKRFCQSFIDNTFATICILKHIANISQTKHLNLMKKLFYFLMVVLAVSFFATSCSKDDEPTTKVVTIGAQDNATTGGFYSVSENKVYTQDAAFQNQSAIDILCFYEAANGNNIAISSPGAGISGIFTGDTAPENWTTANTTYYTKTTLTPSQFDALAETDELIVTSFDTANAYRKAKNLQIDDIYAFKTQAEAYGLLMVTTVTQDSIGSVTFEVKVKK
jgi:hypothetical protein